MARLKSTVIQGKLNVSGGLDVKGQVAIADNLNVVGEVTKDGATVPTAEEVKEVVQEEVSYSDLSGKPTVNSITLDGDLSLDDLSIQSKITSSNKIPYSNISGTPALATVATSGNYNDLSNKPTLGTAAALNTGTSSGNVPVLDSNGKLVDSVIPAVAITDTYEAASEAAMLALSAQKGDVCIRSDLNKSFILSQAPASTLANWKELKTPTDAVLSVNGETGAVQLDASDVGITVTSTSVSDGTNTLNKYTHPTTTPATAAAVKVGKDTLGHVVLGDTLTKSDVGLGNVNNTAITVTSSSVSDGTNTFNKYSHPTTTAVTAGLYKVGKDTLGHVVLGDAFTIPTNTNQKVKAKNSGTDVTFGDNDVVEIVAGSNVTISADASAKTITINSTASGTGNVSDVQVNSTSILSSGVANLITNTAYNSSTNKIATMSDLLDTNAKLSTQLNCYYTIGGVSGTATTPKTWAAGTTVRQVLDDLFDMADVSASIQSYPKLTFDSITSGSYEYGTVLSNGTSIPISLSTTAGSYTFGPATGITWSGYNISGTGITTNSSNTKPTSISLSSDFTVGVSSAISITATANHTAGAYANSKKGVTSNIRIVANDSHSTRSGNKSFSPVSSYYAYYLSNDGTNPGKTGWTKTTSTASSSTDMVCVANVGEYIWIVSNKNGSVYEWNDNKDNYNIDTTDSVKTTSKQITLSTGSDYTYSYLYKIGPRQGATNKKFKIA